MKCISPLSSIPLTRATVPRTDGLRECSALVANLQGFTVVALPCAHCKIRTCPKDSTACQCVREQPGEHLACTCVRIQSGVINRNLHTHGAAAAERGH